MEFEQTTFDVVVIGGGTTGITAALTAAQAGLRVLIIESQLALTGTMANALVTPMMPTFVTSGTQHRQFVQKLEQQAQQSLQGPGSTTIWFSPETAVITAEQLCQEAGITILYQTTVYGVEVVAETIQAVFVQSFNHQLKIMTPRLIDTSGDAIIPRLAGIPVASGDATGHNQAVSFRFEIGNIDITQLRLWCREQGYTFNACDTDSFFEFVHVPNQPACGQLGAIFAAAVANGELEAADIRYIQGFSMPDKPNTLSFNGPQIPASDNTQNPWQLSAYVRTGRMMQQRLWKFLQANIPGFATSFINQEARMLGIRESYRIQGYYELSATDYRQRQKFVDGIAKGDWYIDIHRDDESVEDDAFKQKYTPGEYYEIPYRSLIIPELRNYIAAGRHISCEFAMQSSVRIQATCQMMGEAVGIAAGISFHDGLDFQAIDGQQIKKQLEEAQACHN